MQKHQPNSETAIKLRSDIEHRRLGPWKKWGIILGTLASITIIIGNTPTIGMYIGHAQAIWHAPEQIADLKSSIHDLQSGQTVIQAQGQETREDVRDIKHFLYRQDRMSPIATAKTNSIF